MPADESYLLEHSSFLQVSLFPAPPSKQSAKHNCSNLMSPFFPPWQLNKPDVA